MRASSEPLFGALREGGGTREAGSIVAESLVVLYRAGTHQIRRRRTAAQSSTSQGRAEPLCARIIYTTCRSPSSTPILQYPRRNVTKCVVIQAYRVFCFGFVWCPCMAINVVIVQYDDRYLPDNLLLTQAPMFVWFDDTIIRTMLC